MPEAVHTIQHRIKDESGRSVRVTVEYSVDRVEVFIGLPGAKDPLSSIVAGDGEVHHFTHNPFSGDIEAHDCIAEIEEV